MNSFSKVNYFTFPSATGTVLLSTCTISFANLRLTITEVERAPSEEINPTRAKETCICISSKLNHKQSTPIMIPLQIISSFTCVWHFLKVRNGLDWMSYYLLRICEGPNRLECFSRPLPLLPSPFPIPWPPFVLFAFSQFLRCSRQTDKPFK